MRADNSEQLITAARRRHELTRSKTLQALHELVAECGAVTFQTVAVRAGVSRSWLYAHDDIKAEIQRHRTRATLPSPPVPTRQRATEASLTRRLAIAVERNRQLAEENKRLRRQLETALGQARHPGRHSNSVTIGPC